MPNVTREETFLIGLVTLIHRVYDLKYRGMVAKLTMITSRRSEARRFKYERFCLFLMYVHLSAELSHLYVSRNVYALGMSDNSL